MLLNPQFAARRCGPEGPKPRLGGFRKAVSGHRFYSPNLGRFINRDPIEEQGGINLYGFCGNDGVNKWDYLGLDAEVVHMDGGGYDLRGWSIRATTVSRERAVRMNPDVIIGYADYLDEVAKKRALEEASSKVFIEFSASPQSDDRGEYWLLSPFNVESSASDAPASSGTDPVAAALLRAQGLQGSAPGGHLGDLIAGAIIDGSSEYGLASRNRGPSSRPVSVYDVELGLMRQVGQERDPARREMLQRELEAFRAWNKIRPPARLRDTEFRAAGAPATIRETLDRIARGVLDQHRNDGRVFENRPRPDGTLPLPFNSDPTYYREYVHPTAGISHAARQRILIGANGEIYYSPNHYLPPIIPNPPVQQGPPWNMTSNTENLVVIVPAGIDSADALIQLIATEIRYPYRHGSDWNALFDTLCDLSWLSERKVFIVHEALPQIPEGQLNEYLRVLRDAVGSWYANAGKHELVVTFPEAE